MASAAIKSASSSPADPIPSIAEPTSDQQNDDSGTSSSSSSSSVSEDDASKTATSFKKLQRPRLGSRKSSGTIIVPRDSPNIEIRDEEYDEGDARAMSPRRTSEEIEKLGQEAREALIEQAKNLQASLLNICDRVEHIKTEHEKLEGENKFLQNYIGELMQTTKITSTGAAKNKGKGRGVR